MGWWNAEINPKTGLPFKDEDFNARVAGIKSKYAGVVDALASRLEEKFPGASRKDMRTELAKLMATMDDPPTDPDQLKSWGRKFSGQFRRIMQNKTITELNQRGLVDARGNLAPGVTVDDLESARSELNAEHGAVWGDSGGFELEDAFDPRDMDLFLGLGLQEAEEDSPGSVTGNKPAGEADPATRLKAYYDALYSSGDEQRLGDMAAGQAARGSYAAGVRGGAVGQGIAAAAADAGFQYRNNTNAQALQYLSMDQGVQMHADSLEAQRREFNAQQRAAAAQQAYMQRAQLGGTIGGIIGTGVGAIAQGFGIPGGAQMGGAFGTGIGSMAGGGATPGAYAVRGVGSLAKSGATKGSGNNGGNV